MKFTLITVSAIAMVLIAGKIWLRPVETVPVPPPNTQTNAATESAYVGDHRAKLDLPELHIGDANAKKFSFAVDTVDGSELLSQNMGAELSTQQTIDDISLFDQPINERKNDNDDVQPAILSDL